MGVAGVESGPQGPLPRLRLLLPVGRLLVEGAMDSLGAKTEVTSGSGQQQAVLHALPTPSIPQPPLLTWLVCSQYCSLLPLRMRGSARR